MITWQETFDTLRAAVARKRQILRAYPPQGYDTLVSVYPFPDGTAVVRTRRAKSCD